MTPEEADRLRGRVGIIMLYDGKELIASVSYSDKYGELITLEEQFC